MELNNHTVDLIPILHSLLQAVPVWAIVLWGMHRWVKSSDAADKKLLARLDTIEEEVEGIRLSLASAQLPKMNQKIEEVEQHQMDMKSKLQVLWSLKNRPI